MPPSLPQEIVHQILSNIPSKQLCTLLPTSKSIYLDIIAILHARLQSHLLSKTDHKLIVICLMILSNPPVRSIPCKWSTRCTISCLDIHPHNPRITTLHSRIILLLSTYSGKLWRSRSIVARKKSIPCSIKSDLLIQSPRRWSMGTTCPPGKPGNNLSE